MKYDDKQLKISKKLGAEYFQKLVFIVEKIKYYIIEKFLPNIDKWYYKKCDYLRDKKLKKCNDETKRNRIIEFYRLEKLKFKKELNKKENRNYHIDINNSNEIKKYLEYNKKVHIDGLIGNVVISSIGILLNTVFSNQYLVLLYILLGYETVSAIINFECINLQNYNLCRLENEKLKKILNQKEEKRKKEMIEKMSNGSKVIGMSFKKREDIPTIDDVIKEIKTKEEAQELLIYAKKHLESLKNKEKKKVL